MAGSGLRAGQGGNHGVLRNPRGQTPGRYVGGILSGQTPGLYVGTVSDNLDAVHSASGDGSTLQVLQLIQETIRKAERGITELLEVSSLDNHNFDMPAGPISSESLEVGKQTEQGSNLKETTVGNELGAMESVLRQLGNLGIRITPQFFQQHAGKFGIQRKAVKITHHKTPEMLWLD